MPVCVEMSTGLKVSMCACVWKRVHITDTPALLSAETWTCILCPEMCVWLSPAWSLCGHPHEGPAVGNKASPPPAVPRASGSCANEAAFPEARWWLPGAGGSQSPELSCTAPQWLPCQQDSSLP